MSESDRPPIVCPDCGTTYRWRSDFADKELHCRCGAVFHRPAEADGGQASDETTRRFGSSSLGYKSPIVEALENRQYEARAPRFRDLYLPAFLLPVGLVLHVWLWTLFTDRWLTLLLAVLGAVAVQAAVFVPIMLGALAMTAGWFQVALGNLFGVLFKAASLTLGLGAAADVLLFMMLVLLDFAWWTPLVGFAYYALPIGLPLAIMFGMNFHETALVIFMVYVPRVVAAYLAAVLFGQFFGM